MWTGAEYTEFLESPILMAALATVHPFSFCNEQMNELGNELMYNYCQAR